LPIIISSIQVLKFDQIENSNNQL